MEEKQIDYLLIDRADDYLERGVQQPVRRRAESEYARNPLPV